MTVATVLTNMQRKRLYPLIDYPLLLVVAVIADLLIPFLIWKGFLPDITRWITDLTIAAILCWGILRMAGFNHVPRGFLLIIALTLIGTMMAAFEGQQAAATAWGWWRMFRYPMIAVYAYLQPQWPADFARNIFRFCMINLGVQVLVQLGQYFTGEPPGDNLAGSFGAFGTGNLVLFIIFTWCLGLGLWLRTGEWRQLVWVLVAGAVSSALGEMKIFPLMVMLLGLMTLFFYQIHGGNLKLLFGYVAVLGIVVLAFVGIYNSVVAQGPGTKRIEEYLNWQQSDDYINSVWYHPETYTYEFGRGFAMTYAWKQISGDPAAALFGQGIGSQSESASLGIIGKGLQESLYGLTVGTSLSTLLQEVGIVGLTLIMLFLGWAVITLYRLADRTTDHYLAASCYALMLFSCGWPLWLWYGNIYEATVPMVLYWGTLGYVLNQLARPAVLAQFVVAD
jgi:hypothetical protein